MENQAPVPNIRTTTENLTEHVGGYLDTYLQLVRVTAAQKATRVAAEGITALVLSTASLFFLLFLSIGAAVWLGEVLQDYKVGFFWVSGFYSVIALLIFLLRKNILLPRLRDYIVRNLYE